MCSAKYIGSEFGSEPYVNSAAAGFEQALQSTPVNSVKHNVSWMIDGRPENTAEVKIENANLVGSTVVFKRKGITKHSAIEERGITTFHIPEEDFNTHIAPMMKSDQAKYIGSEFGSESHVNSAAIAFEQALKSTPVESVTHNVSWMIEGRAENTAEVKMENANLVGSTVVFKRKGITKHSTIEERGVTTFHIPEEDFNKHIAPMMKGGHAK